MSYTMYTPLNVWLDPASVTDVVAYIQTYLSENTIYSETEIETIIHDYLIAHPELIGGVQSVNGKTGTVVLSASDINTENNVTIESVLANLKSNIDNMSDALNTKTAIIKKQTATNIPFTIVQGKRYKITNGSATAFVNIQNSGTAVQNIGTIQSNTSVEFTSIANADAVRVYPDDDTTITVMELNEFGNVIFVDVNTNYADVITKLNGFTGKTILILKGNITNIPNNLAFPSGLSLVIGLGGIFDTTRTGDTVITFSEGCRFVCGNYRLFNDYIMPMCSTGYLEGEAKPIWWGAVADGSTDITNRLNCMNVTSFRTIHFTPGVYRGYFTNSKDGRTLIFDNGAIIDGVVHVAYGSTAGAATKRWCKNTIVKGKVVSTIRVGGAQADGLSMPDGIEILGTNSTYLNQTAAGGPRGVHWHFGCKNIDIGTIVVNEIVQPLSGYAYAVGIDSEDNEEIPHDIHIHKIVAGANTSNYYDIIMTKAYNIKIDDVYAESGIGLLYSMFIGYGAHDIDIGKYTTKFDTTTAGNSAFLISASENVRVHDLNVIPDLESVSIAWGVFINVSNNVFIDNLHTKYLSQGARVINSNNILIVSHITEHDTTAIAQSGSTTKVLNTFTVT